MAQMTFDKIPLHIFKANQNFEQVMQAILNTFGMYYAPAADLVTIASAIYHELLSHYTTFAAHGFQLPEKKILPILREIANNVHAGTGAFANFNALLLFEDDPTDVLLQIRKDIAAHSALIKQLSQQQHAHSTWIKHEDVDADLDKCLHQYFTKFRTWTAADFTALINYNELSTEKRRSHSDFVRSYFLACFKDTIPSLLSQVDSQSQAGGVQLIVQIMEQKSHLRLSTNIQGLISNAINDYGVNDNSSCALEQEGESQPRS